MRLPISPPARAAAATGRLPCWRSGKPWHFSPALGAAAIDAAQSRARQRRRRGMENPDRWASITTRTSRSLRWLCPPRLRPPIAAIYRFARTADDIADEGDARAEQRLAGPAPPIAPTWTPSRPAGRRRRRWPEVFGPLARAIAAHRLPVPLLPTCSTPSRRTSSKHALRRPRRAARLLPPLGQPDRPPAAAPVRRRRRGGARAVATPICSALQLTNFWQDLGVDAARGRLYVPRADCARARRRRRRPRLARRDGAPRRTRWSPTSSPGRAR